MMTPETPIRLEFEHPPLVEQAISVSFSPIKGFRIIDYGLFWTELNGAFPNVRVDNRLETIVEQFEGFKPKQQFFEVVSQPILPRAMFQNETTGELVQVQNDRFGFNWAKVRNEPYPRSEPLMKRFVELFNLFSKYIENQNIGNLELNQCEITNLNIIKVSDFGMDYTDLTKALNVDPLDLGLPYLRSETLERSRQHLILGRDETPLGRLHMMIAPVISSIDGTKAFRFELTARSAPNIKSVEQMLRFFQVARNTINGAFNASATPAMKRKWGEKNV